MAGISTPGTVSVQITSSMTSFTSEKRLQRGDTISTLKVVDKDPTKKAGQFEDLSAVEKYEMTTEDYSKRAG